MSGFRDAVTFLTRLPVGARVEAELEMSSGAAWFPVVGAVVAAILGGVYWVAHQLVPGLLAAAITIASGLLITGAIHEDGLADTADAFGSGATGSLAIEIMRDSRLGTYGVAALTISITWRIAALSGLALSEALAGLVMAHTLSRAAVVVLMRTTPRATTEGLGSVMTQATKRRDMLLAPIGALVISAVAGGVWLLAAVVVAALPVAWLRWSSTRRIGGITGDVLGACQQIAEMLVLAAVAGLAFAGVGLWWSA